MGQNDPVAVSVVVPVYAGASALAELAQRTATSMSTAGLTHELILVDDRGDPRAWPMICEIARSRPEVRGIRLGRNFGQHAATACGIAHARGEWVVTMDDDLEHPPEAIPKLVHACDEDHPLVYGVFPVRTHARYRNITSELMRWTLKKAFPDLNDSYTSYRVMRASLARELTSFSMSRPYIDGILSWITTSVATVEVSHGERQHGESAYTMKRLISHAVNIFVTFSQLPLRVATYGGAALASMSFLYLLYILYGRIAGTITSPGYTSLMSVVLFACGVQLVILGMLGEYVGRLMGATIRKPMYSVEATTQTERA
ncbi:glycosyltransferase family 2 protein [Lysobacter sp. S4-A87]|uniref:glycosyltransferase family 2 protein n=1 Tax=Lysobacter sp. S4-A87 TaxID=2925843 RepID=UPI001F531626|nr:glycosyltransferase family 2 protein [Lysobacter sp. S4-A87]UNK48889.1 glycosyltransferase family 2 protein [Lysobacter sp. S4-A87]